MCHLADQMTRPGGNPMMRLGNADHGRLHLPELECLIVLLRL